MNYLDKLLNERTATVFVDETINSGDVKSLYIENPLKDNVCVFETVELDVNDGAIGRYYRNPDVSGGTPIPTTVDMIGSDIEIPFTALEDGDITGEHINIPLSKSGGQANPVTSTRPQFALGPNSAVGFEIEATTNNTDVLLMANFWKTTTYKR